MGSEKPRLRTLTRTGGARADNPSRAEYTTKPLSAATWPAFARLVEKHNGIFGGCWCISFHLGPTDGKRSKEEYRVMKEARVREGRAHAALVFDGPEAIGWCQYGSPQELPNIRSRRAYEMEPTRPPDWRITCFFIDRQRRGAGVAQFALEAALVQIASLGGGLVEAYPEDYTGLKVSNSFLCSGTLGMFEKAGFVKTRKIAMHRWVVTRAVSPARTRGPRPAPRSEPAGTTGFDRGSRPSAPPPAGRPRAGR